MNIKFSSPRLHTHTHITLARILSFSTLEVRLNIFGTQQLVYVSLTHVVQLCVKESHKFPTLSPPV